MHKKISTTLISSNKILLLVISVIFLDSFHSKKMVKPLNCKSLIGALFLSSDVEEVVEACRQ